MINKLTSAQLIVYGFFSLIILGAILLSLPIASSTNQATSFLDALFTSTSAVCVTGLVVQDTATYWSTFGQIIILLLIQIGGIVKITGFILKTTSYQPDIILLDLGLPDIDGVDIIKQIHSFSNVPIIVISARSEDNDKGCRS